MIRSLCSIPGQELRTDISVQEYASALKDPDALLWIDFDNEPNASAGSILTDIFHFHQLAVDDALNETHVPKIDDWGEYVYLVLNAVVFNESDGLSIITKELDVFLGKNYVVTHHDVPISSLDEARLACLRDKRYTSNGPDHLLYKIIDDLVADYMPMIEALDSQIDRVEDEVLVKAAPDTLERIFALKRVLLSMRRILTPQREVLSKLARDDYEVVDPKDRVFFRDVYDHLVRLHDINESMRDLVGGALDTYLSVINNRMNEVMKTLTIITTMFMPISFITGFFGMNFFEPSGGLTSWTNNLVFGLVMVVFIILPIGMLIWMKNRTWV
jgi:magnesium transporter